MGGRGSLTKRLSRASFREAKRKAFGANLPTLIKPYITLFGHLSLQEKKIIIFLFSSEKQLLCKTRLFTTFHRREMWSDLLFPSQILRLCQRYQNHRRGRMPSFVYSAVLGVVNMPARPTWHIQDFYKTLEFNRFEQILIMERVRSASCSKSKTLQLSKRCLALKNFVCWRDYLKIYLYKCSFGGVGKIILIYETS